MKSVMTAAAIAVTLAACGPQAPDYVVFGDVEVFGPADVGLEEHLEHFLISYPGPLMPDLTQLRVIRLHEKGTLFYPDLGMDEHWYPEGLYPGMQVRGLAWARAIDVELPLPGALYCELVHHMAYWQTGDLDYRYELDAYWGCEK